MSCGQRAHVEVEELRNRLRRLVVERARKAHAGAVDQHVGVGPLRRQRRLDSGDGIWRGDVGGDGNGLDLELGANALGCGLERLGRRATRIRSLPAAAKRRASA